MLSQKLLYTGLFATLIGLDLDVIVVMRGHLGVAAFRGSVAL